MALKQKIYHLNIIKQNINKEQMDLNFIYQINENIISSHTYKKRDHDFYG